MTTRSTPGTSSIPRASFAPPVPPARTTTGRRHKPVILIPACALWRTLMEMSSGVSCSVRRAISRRPASTQRSPSMRSISVHDGLLVGLAVTAHQDVLVERVAEVAQQRRADGVQRRHDADAVGRHLLGLLRRGALPDAQRARRLAGHGGRQRHRRVDEQLPLAQGAPEVRQRLGLVAEGHAQDHGLGAAGGLVVREPLEAALGDRRAGALRRLRRPARVARAHDDGHPGAAPSHRQAEAERPGGADDAHGREHQAGEYKSPPWRLWFASACASRPVPRS